MPCNTVIEPACRGAGHLLQTVTGAAAGGVLGGIALAVMAGVKWIVADTATWWVQIPSPDLAAEPAVPRIPQWPLPLTPPVAGWRGSLPSHLASPPVQLPPILVCLRGPVPLPPSR